MANTRWGLNLPRSRPEEDRPRPRRRVPDRKGPRGDQASRSVAKGRIFLDEDFGFAPPLRLGPDKFGVDLKLDEIKTLRRGGLQEVRHRPGPDAYDRKEAEYPVMAGIYRCGGGAARSQLDREELVAWARERFGIVARTSTICATRHRPRCCNCCSPTASVRRRQAGEGHRRSAASRRRTGRRRATSTRRGLLNRSPPGPRKRWRANRTAEEIGGARRGSARRTAAARCRRPLPPRDAPDGAVAPAADPRYDLERPPAGDGPPAQLASACSAMPRSIPRSSTSAKACGCSSRCGSRSATA